jgi:hypothetical protein
LPDPKFIFQRYSEGAQASQTNFNYSKVSFPFYKDCRIFCEGEWEGIIKRDGIAIINKNNRNNLQLLVFGLITAFDHNMAFSLIKVFGLIILVGNVGNMLATCCADTSMSASFPNIPFFFQHPFLPIWLFLRPPPKNVEGFISEYVDCKKGTFF